MPNENDLTRLMDLREVATALHVSPHTIRAWTRTGRIHPTRICRRLLFDPVDIEEFVRASQATRTTSHLGTPKAGSSPIDTTGQQ